MILPGTARMPLVRSYWAVAVANVLPVDKRWPLPLRLQGPQPCPRCGHVEGADDVLAVLKAERPGDN
jgi:hypothetical protein